MDININGVDLRVWRNGDIFRYFKGKGGFYREIPNKKNTTNGYNQITLNYKGYLKHRIIAYCYLGLNINNTEIQIDHIDHNRINNNVENLRLVSGQENQFNRSNVKGYCLEKKTNKYKAQIVISKKSIHLGVFETEEEAHNAYLEAKEKYHIFN